MKKYALTAYIIMGILAFITIIALILAHININSNKAIINRNDENIMALVEDAINLCLDDYSAINASEEDMKSIDEYIENIEEQSNVRTKANIALSMLTHTGDHITSENAKGNVSYSDNENMQKEIAPLILSIENALEINQSKGE